MFLLQFVVRVSVPAMTSCHRKSCVGLHSQKLCWLQQHRLDWQCHLARWCDSRVPFCLVGSGLGSLIWALTEFGLWDFWIHIWDPSGFGIRVWDPRRSFVSGFNMLFGGPACWVYLVFVLDM